MITEITISLSYQNTGERYKSLEAEFLELCRRYGLKDGIDDIEYSGLVTTRTIERSGKNITE
jgi:hypothetical protein